MSDYVIWEQNDGSTDLPSARAGDIVHLRFTDGFSYLVKAMVSETLGSRIDVIVEAVFDGTGQGQVTSGSALDLLGSSLTITSKEVHKVIHRNGSETD